LRGARADLLAGGDHRLTLAIVAINGCNRLAISMRTPVGSYVSPHHQEGT
jgi:hypothetical protein